MASSLLNIFLIFSAAFLTHITSTSPNPSPNTARHYGTVLEKTCFNNMVFITVGIKVVTWALGIAEVGIILSKHTPSWKYTPAVQKFLLSSGDPEMTGELTSWTLVGTGLIIGGGLLRWSCYRTLGRFFTFEITLQKGHELVTTGPYSVVRHPSYSGGLMMTTGIFIWQGGPYSWLRQSGILMLLGGKAITAFFSAGLVAWGCNTVYRTRVEDQILSAEFGDQWREWATRVPYTLVPYIF